MQKNINKTIRTILSIVVLIIAFWEVAQIVSLYYFSRIGEKRVVYQDDKMVIYESSQGALGADYVLGYYHDSLLFRENKRGEISFVRVEYSDSINVEITIYDHSFGNTPYDTLRIRRVIAYPS